MEPILISDTARADMDALGAASALAVELEHVDRFGRRVGVVAQIFVPSSRTRIAMACDRPGYEGGMLLGRLAARVGAPRRRVRRPVTL